LSARRGEPERFDAADVLAHVDCRLLPRTNGSLASLEEQSMARLPLVAALLLATLAMSGAARAHHSGAMFDRSKEVSIEGEVSEWRWSNPHSWLQIHAPHNGQPEALWSFESTSTQILVKQGWRRTSLKPGDKVTVAYNPFKDGAAGGNLVRVTMPDGTVFGPPPKVAEVAR
jgi:hypothetical protein